jgi:hypothetical protein
MFRRVRDELKLPAAIMLDTKGPEIRVGNFKNGAVELKSGDKFTFTRENEKLNLDGTNRLVFTAVYNKADNVKAGFEYNFKVENGQFAGALPGDLEYIKIAYGAGIVPASANFDRDASVTLSDLVKIGERLYYRSKGEASYFETDAERLADMVQKGVCESIRNLDKNATYTDTDGKTYNRTIKKFNYTGKGATSVKDETTIKESANFVKKGPDGRIYVAYGMYGLQIYDFN